MGSEGGTTRSMAPLPDESPCGLLTTDLAGHILWANKRFCDWLGYDVEALVAGKRWQDLLNVGGRIFSQTHFQPLLQMQGSVAEVKLDFLHGDGSTVPMVVNAHKAERQGMAVYDIAAFIARDRDRYEREILASRRKFEEMAAFANREQEVARDRALFAEQMVGIVSHDLRNPLSAVMLGVDALNRIGLGERPQAVVKRIGRSANRASRLISELLDFTSARLGKGLPVNRASHDLHALVADIVEELSPSFDYRLVHEKNLETSDSGTQVDADRLAQLVGNLIANAGAYGAPEHPITVTSRTAKGHASVTVHNHGRAIPKDVQASLFQPMVRGTAGNAQRSVGLGLYIVAEIAKAHGGTVHLQSSSEAGTSFTVHFPHETQGTSS